MLGLRRRVTVDQWVDKGWVEGRIQDGEFAAQNGHARLACAGGDGPGE